MFVIKGTNQARLIYHIIQVGVADGGGEGCQKMREGGRGSGKI